MSTLPSLARPAYVAIWQIRGNQEREERYIKKKKKIKLFKSKLQKTTVQETKKCHDVEI